MKDKLSYGWYVIALFGGLVSGLSMSKAQYYKGQSDAYDQISNQLKESIDKIEKELEESEKEES